MVLGDWIAGIPLRPTFSGLRSSIGPEIAAAVYAGAAQRMSDGGVKFRAEPAVRIGRHHD